MDRIKMKKRMNLARITTNLVIAFVVGGFVFVGLIRSAAAADPNNLACKFDQACNAVPSCPTGNGECDSCSHTVFNHMKCKTKTDASCVVDPPTPGGCGVKVEGICDSNDNCIFTVTEEPCSSLACHDPNLVP